VPGLLGMAAHSFCLVLLSFGYPTKETAKLDYPFGVILAASLIPFGTYPKVTSAKCLKRLYYKIFAFSILLENRDGVLLYYISLVISCCYTVSTLLILSILFQAVTGYNWFCQADKNTVLMIVK
jgi:hypothetical protein